MIWNLKISLQLLNSIALEILNTNYMYILLKLKTRKFAFSNRIAPTWNSFLPCTKKAPSTNQFKSLLDKDTNWYLKKKKLKYFIMSNAIGKLKCA